MDDMRGSGAAVYAGRARQLQLPFAEVVHLGRARGTNLAAAARRSRIAMAEDGTAYIAPEEYELPSFAGWLAAQPEMRARLVLATPEAIRTALEREEARRLDEARQLDEAVNGLARRHPQFSARQTATRAQVLAGSAGALVLCVGLLTARFETIGAINLLAAALFLAIAILRLIAAAQIRGRVPTVPVRRADEAELPVYTVLAPLHGEAEIAADLVRALLCLDWPREKLDVKIITEADDTKTLAAVRRAVEGTPFEVVVVPAGAPQTKPRALAYALPLARGEFVTVYDAEDRPHPGQLRQAWATFQEGDSNLACVQAALVIDNEEEGWLPRLFAIEYAALFDGLLPALAEHGMPVPLGGTSNHFRRKVLDEIGGWDCYNVTEDADVGVRLARFGYRTAVIDLPTLEDAPDRPRIWLRQRTRWLKGWLQTWLVHTRNPLQLCRDLGLKGALCFQLTSVGIVASAMIYPIFIATLLILLLDPIGLWERASVWHTAALTCYVFNLVIGHAAMLMLSAKALKMRGRSNLAGSLALLPLYWLFMSLAAYRAAFELIRQPHHWEKTPHRRHSAARRVSETRAMRPVAEPRLS